MGLSLVLIIGFLYLLFSNKSLKKRLEDIKNDIDLSTAIYEINDERQNKFKKAPPLKAKLKTEVEDSCQLSLDFFFKK